MAQAKPKSVPAYFVSDHTQLAKTGYNIVHAVNRIWAGHSHGECGSAPCCQFQVQLSSSPLSATYHKKSTLKLNIRYTIEKQCGIESNNALIPGLYNLLS